MKATTIVRKLDNLGRITLPKDLRRTMNIGNREPMEIFTEEDKIILKKAEYDVDICYCCQQKKHVTKLYDRNICDGCAELMYKSLEKTRGVYGGKR